MYIIKITHKNGKRLDVPLFMTNNNNGMYDDIKFAKLFNTDSEALRAAGVFAKSRKQNFHMTVDCTIVPYAPVIEEVKPAF